MVLFTYSLMGLSHMNKKKLTGFFLNFSCVYWCFTETDIYRKSWPSRPRTSSALTTLYLYTTVLPTSCIDTQSDLSTTSSVITGKVQSQPSITHVLCVANQYNYYYYLWFTKVLRAQHRQIHIGSAHVCTIKAVGFWRTF